MVVKWIAFVFVGHKIPHTETLRRQRHKEENKWLIEMLYKLPVLCIRQLAVKLERSKDDKGTNILKCKGSYHPEPRSFGERSIHQTELLK
jgi:hypothetical protein